MKTQVLNLALHSPAAKTGVKIGAFIAAVLLLNLAGAWLAAQANFQIWPEHMPIIELMWMAMLVTYLVLMMLPFVPGIEIGLVLMMMLGDSGILLVYLVTQVALSASYWMGRSIPVATMTRGLRPLGMARTADLLVRAQTISPQERTQWLSQRYRNRFCRWLLSNQCGTLAVLINLPGNAVIGGAGGIGLLAGNTGLISYRRYLATMAVATAPLPLFLLISGLAG